MRRLLQSALMLLTLAGVALCAPDVAGRRNGAVRQDRCQDGRYNIVVRGSYRGTGEADVNANQVRLRALVKTEDGRSGRLDALLPAAGPYFGGTGTVIGSPAAIRGRMDAARASRLVVTFVLEDGSAGGRVVGLHPNDPGDDSWDDDAGN